jgi:hypothetical protein
MEDKFVKTLSVKTFSSSLSQSSSSSDFGLSVPSINSMDLDSEPPSNKSSQFQDFLKLVQDDLISLQTADDYVTRFPKSLSANAADGKSAIQYAGENRNIPLFHLLIRRKQAMRRAHLKDLSTKEQKFRAVYSALETFQ